MTFNWIIQLGDGIVRRKPNLKLQKGVEPFDSHSSLNALILPFLSLNFCNFESSCTLQVDSGSIGTFVGKVGRSSCRYVVWF